MNEVHVEGQKDRRDSTNKAKKEEKNAKRTTALVKHNHILSICASCLQLALHSSCKTKTVVSLSVPSQKNTMQTIFRIAEGSTTIPRYSIDRLFHSGCTVDSLFSFVGDFLGGRAFLFRSSSLCLVIYFRFFFHVFSSVIVGHDERILTVCPHLNWPPLSAS